MFIMHYVYSIGTRIILFINTSSAHTIRANRCCIVLSLMYILVRIHVWDEVSGYLMRAKGN